MNKIWDYKSITTQDLEYENLYKRFYHFGAHKSELANNKDYLICKIYDFEVVLYNDYGNIIAFYNACPHRGARLMDTSYDCTHSGSGSIVCKYHHWSFSKGTLHIKEREEFCKNVDLFRLKVAYCGEFIFFGLSPIMSLKQQLGDYFTPILRHSKSIKQRIDINDKTKFKSNWKIGIENSIEPYHIDAVHPNSLAPLGMENVNTFSTANSKVSGTITNAKYHKRLRANKPLFCDDNYYEETYFSYYIFPFTILSSTFGYSYSVQTFFPHTPQDTHFTCRSYGVNCNFDETLWNESIIKINKQIFDEDAVVANLVQGGSITDGMGLVYAKQKESRILDFHKHYKRYMGLSNGL